MSTSREKASFKLPVSCLADFMSSKGRSAEALLRPYKFNKNGEGFARSSYYRLALSAIRDFHTSNNDPVALQTALCELQSRSATTQKNRERVKLEKNISAIEAYERVYGKRRFTVLPNHRIGYRIGNVVFTAQPDLWVEEDGKEVLLKIGIPRKKPSYIDVLLTVIRKAAVSSGYRRVRARNVVYLDITNRREMICAGSLTRFNRTFRAIVQEIANAWPRVSAHPDGGRTR